MDDSDPFDIILLHGQVVDGSGSPRYRADVGIRGDRVAAIGDLSTAPGGLRRDVSDLVVAPGFVDTHTHDDLALLNWPEMPFKVSQGVTTVVVGNCGISPAPLAWAGRREPLPRPLDLLGDVEEFRFPTFAVLFGRAACGPACGERRAPGRTYHVAGGRNAHPRSSGDGR